MPISVSVRTCKFVGRGRRAAFVDGRRHHRHYRLKELREKVKNPGFNIILSRYFDFVGTFAGYLVHILGGDHVFGGDQTFSSGMACVYDSVCIPITRNLECITPPVFGKSVIMVARKRKIGRL